MTPRTTLLEPVLSLTKALTSHARLPISTLLSTFTTQPTPLVHEHGLPQLAPFLGRSFTGQDGVARYFELLSDLLSLHDLTFEAEEEWLVDESNLCISLRGAGTFQWKSTAQAWDETFVYRIALARDNSDDPAKRDKLLVCEYRVWADTGAAYLAKLGRLGELVDSRVGEGGLEGIYLEFRDEDEERKKKEEGNVAGTETMKSRDRKKSGCQDVLGGGLNVYGSCG